MGSQRSFAQERWGVILAGGDGMRLRPLTRLIAGDDRPKMVGRVPTLLGMVERAVPDLFQAFAGIQPALGTTAERAVACSLYARLPEVNFSREVLAASPGNLAVVPVTGVRWSDWGDPGRVLTTLARIGHRPAWAQDPQFLPA